MTATALAADMAGKRPRHALKRAQRKQQDAAAAMPDAGGNPALGALNRHLNMLTQQLGTAHRDIGRVAAERDALRQRLADLQGIPVEEIVVTSTGASIEDQQKKTREPGEPQPQTGLARLNFFRHEDIHVMRKRRQIFVLVLLSIVVVLWLLGRVSF
jgi:hypothetical protein